MSTKTWVTLGMLVGSTIGSYVPLLFGADVLSYSSIFWGGVGAILGIFLGYKASNL